MQPIRFEFNSVHHEELINSLAGLLGTTPVNRTVLIPPALGAGSVVQKELADGLVVVCWDFQLKTDVVFAKLLNSLEKDGRSLMINYLLSADDILMESPSLNCKFNLKGDLNILLLPDDADLNFEIRAGIHVRVVTLSVQPAWLQLEFGNIEPVFSRYLPELLHSPVPSVFMETGTPEEFRMLAGLLARSAQIPQGMLPLKPRMMTLLADFLTRISAAPITDLTESRILHYQKMKQVEDLLRTFLEMQLPDMATIARTVALSISTLKRHFKIVFGMGVYEYYLTLKMEHAKWLLIEKDMTVNETAALLQYENVSSFIDMFKRHHGYSPGSLRKRAG